MGIGRTEIFDVDVLISGSGAAGLTLAIDLARRGVSFWLIEKMVEPFRGSRGKGIQPRSQEILEDLGVLDRIFAAGGEYPQQREYREDGSHQDCPVMESRAPLSAEPYPIPRLVPQFRTEGIMRERLAELGLRPRFGWELQTFEEDDSGVTARISEPSGTRTVRVRYLVGTDGGRSLVRHTLGVDFPGKTLGVRAVVADVALTGLSTDVWHRFNEGSMDRQISFCPLPGTDLFQLQGPIPLEGDIDLSARGLNTLIAERTPRSNILIESVSWASAFNMNARLADHYRVGRVFLAGDAAHIHPPTGGQGLNTSLQDAYNLGWKLAAVLNGASEALLDTYEEERRPIAAHTLGLTSGLLEAMKRGMMRRGREVHQIDLGYPESSLALGNSRQGCGLLAGDRAPDASLRGAAGQPTRLFELFKGPSWTLLGFKTDRSAISPRANLHIHIVSSDGDVVDEKGDVQDGYGVSAGDWILVRPDGYVGAIVSSGEITALEHYMAQVGLAV
jgi:2-polyprenyl-6-methoxyphenol hydroxylase-like FAD-dependent oxidoreductase